MLRGRLKRVFEEAGAGLRSRSWSEVGLKLGMGVGGMTLKSGGWGGSRGFLRGDSRRFRVLAWCRRAGTCGPGSAKLALEATMAECSMGSESRRGSCWTTRIDLLVWG